MIEHQMDKKQCTKCGEIKSIYDFYFVDKRRGYLSSNCKICNHEANKKSYQRNKEKNLKKNINWQEKNRDRHNFHQRMYYARQREGKKWGLF